MRDVFQEIADRIAAQLADGVRPWSKPWTGSAHAADLPHNISGRPYRGANVFWLWCAAEAAGYASPLWMTYKQAQERGGNVRKGEKSTPVFFWLFDKVKDKETGEEKNRVLVKTYYVFNVAQCDGIEAPAPREPMPEPERIAAAEALIEATGAEITHGGGQACYMPSVDRIRMPTRDSFMDSDGYYSTMFHEIGHWTGAETRLNRTFGKRFGDQAYAAEELVAELTAAFVCASQGFASIDRPDHAAYLGHWLKMIKADPKAFITAASAAQKAADYILKAGEAAGEAEPEIEGEAIAA